MNRRLRHHRGWGMALAVAMGLASCTGAGESSGQPSTSGPDTTVAPVEGDIGGPDPTLEQISALLDDDGHLPLDTALRLFAETVGPLPGVDPMEVEGDGHGVAGLAVRVVIDHVDDLSPELRSAVQEALDPDEEDLVFEVDPRSDAVRRVAYVTQTDDATRDRIADELLPVLRSLEVRSGLRLQHPVRVHLKARHPVKTWRAWAIAHPSVAAMTRCEVTLTRVVVDDEPIDRTETLAHELWHCFQYEYRQRNQITSSPPAWMIEGQAAWVGQAFVGGSGWGASQWDTWLTTHDKSLFKRSYDAIGIYALAQMNGAIPWQTMLPMLGAGNVDAVETLFGHSAEVSVRQTAQSLVRRPSLGLEWESAGPGITRSSGTYVRQAEPGRTIRVERNAVRYSTMPIELTIPAGELLTITVEGGPGAARVPDSGTVVLAPGQTATFCLAASGCVCPNGDAPAVGNLSTGRPGAGAVAVGTVEGARIAVVVTMSTLDEACSGSIVGEWHSTLGEVLSVDTAPYGSPGDLPRCEGPYVVSFGADGSYAGRFEGTCSFAGTQSTMQGWGSGRYELSDEEPGLLSIHDAAGSGTATVNGVTMTLPWDQGFVDGFARFRIEGDLLYFSYVHPDGARVTQVFSRSPDTRRPPGRSETPSPDDELPPITIDLA